MLNTIENLIKRFEKNKLIENLDEADRILSDESKWTKVFVALDHNDEPCCVESENATRFCLFGAIRRAYGARVGLVPSANLAIIGFLVEQKEYQNSEGALIGTAVLYNDDPKTSFQDIKNLIQEAKTFLNSK